MACSGCGAEILWATGPAGRTIPLDAAPLEPAARLEAVTRRVQTGKGPTLYCVVGARAVRFEPPDAGADLYVSHFTTCPEASQFSGRGRA